MSETQAPAVFRSLIKAFQGKALKADSDFSRQAPAVKEALKILETLTYSERVRQMIALGQASVKTSVKIKSKDGQIERIEVAEKVGENIAAFLKQMEKGEFYERHLSLLAAAGSNDGKRALAALQDRSSAIRRQAQTLLPRLLSSEQLISVLPTLKRHQQKCLLQRLRCMNRTEAVDRFLMLSKEADSELFIAFLAYGSRALVEKQIDTYHTRFSQSDWKRLAAFQPQTTLSKLLALAKQATVRDPQLLRNANAAIAKAARVAPEQAIELVSELTRFASLNEFNLRDLLPRQPKAIAKLALRSHDSLRTNLSGCLQRLNDDDRLALVSKHSESFRYAGSWFKKLPPDWRLKLYQGLKDSWRDGNGCLPVEILKLLPEQVRLETARQHLEFEQISAQPHIRLPYAQFLPFSECREVLNDYLADPDVELRALAMRVLTSCLRFCRSAAMHLLEQISAKPNQPDPVKNAYLNTLAVLPPKMWHDEHLDLLGKIFQDALDSKDVSQGSISAIETFIVYVAPFHMDWAVTWLKNVYKHTSNGYLGRVGQRLNDAQARELVNGLAPALKSWQAVEKEYSLIRLCTSLDRRLKVCDRLVEMLERLVFKASNKAVAESALQCLARHCKERFDKIVPVLLKDDPSWSQRWLVSQHLHERRQDLLTPYLGQNKISGAFATGKIRIVPGFCYGFHRWTETQIKIFGQSLVAATKNRDASVADSLSLLRQIASLPDGPAEVVIDASRSDDEANRARQNYAIMCLADLDDERGIDELLSCLNDKRAPLAIYHLRKALLEMPPDKALALLKSVPDRSITVTKEVIRLIGDLGTKEAYEELLERRKALTHRDLQIALIRALWNYLNEDQTWDIIEEFRQSTDTAGALHLVRIPAERLTENAQTRLSTLMSELIASADGRVRMAVLNRLGSMPILDRERLLYKPMLKALGSTIASEYQAAANALLCTYAAQDESLIEETVASLLARDKRRNFTALMSRLVNQANWGGAAWQKSARAAVGVLKKDSLTIDWQIKLACAYLSYEEIISLLREIHEGGSLHAGALASAVDSVTGCAARPDADQLATVEDQLAGDSSESLRRIALAALIGQSRTKSGWTEELLERLQKFRNDRSALVASAAQFTFPANEPILYAISGSSQRNE